MPVSEGTFFQIESLPVWECGLKYGYTVSHAVHLAVTPCVGVWIEIVMLIKL